jgi:hypothetical protein
MRTILTFVGAFCILAGVVWFFQGIGMLPGSFMTGQRQWAVYGAITVALGFALLAVARRRRS